MQLLDAPRVRPGQRLAQQGLGRRRIPGLDGLEVCRRLKGDEATKGIPIIMVTARVEEIDRLLGLELGADDYLTKPYSIRELLARVRTSLRRSTAEVPAAGSEERVMAAGSIELDQGRYQLRAGEMVFDLPRKEFEVMEALMVERGRIVPRERLLDDIWGITWTDSKTLDQHIRRLRRKLEQVEGAPRIETVRGVGYRLDV